MFTIYHIPGIKIGLTKRNPYIRVREQGYKSFEIIETHLDEKIAAEREFELQNQYGYINDKAKYDFNRLSENGKLMGAINGKKNITHGKYINRINKRIPNFDKNESYGSPKIPIIVYDIFGNLIGNYQSINRAAKEINVRPGYIRNVLAGRIQKTKKYTFEYK